MAGRRTDLYQRMLANLAEQARYLDEHGYYGVAFTEHHLTVMPIASHAGAASATGPSK